MNSTADDYTAGTAQKPAKLEKESCHKNKRQMLLITDDDFTVHFFRQREKEIGKWQRDRNSSRPETER